MIIRNGRNYLVSLLEERVAQVLGHPVHEIMVLDADIHEPDSDIVAVVENAPKTADVDDFARRALRELDLPVDVVAFASARVIPRTTSGKKKYDRTRRALAEQSVPVTHVVRLN